MIDPHRVTLRHRLDPTFESGQSRVRDRTGQMMTDLERIVGLGESSRLFMSDWEITEDP